ncbi:DUF3536 domain-containing protein [Tunicatimonas pelagia]|uniref:DUF3536 domain-containing protein n=1 Tax=Tunicatimonas pelagia TaxID=931531 RepID=UPI002666AC87|nr:DUF3536 domain-containing protein [Tunicatimonas pelagia]WKN43456.1 DUF3536 domain-containing protein [Tunicatimonas pelagia]
MSNKNKYVCIHGHFYQPPRENPWLNRVEVQDSAYPFHDWNERITAECYSRNSAARILDEKRRIQDIINNYAKISFNFGPTLLQWMKLKAPDVYEAILEADRLSQEQFSGHGSAIAQAYNHLIVPLANARDQETQVLWGIRDFEARFKRYPEGMWLPETAVNTETLEVLAKHGIKYTILSPYQALKVRKIGAKDWQDATGAKVDPRRPYLCNLPSGQTIALFFYDGPVSQGIAFEGLLNNGAAFAGRLMDQLDHGDKKPQIMHIATDGESYGHHHRYGEMGLSYCLHQIDNDPNVSLTIYGEFLEKHPPEYEAKIIENTAWSSTPHLERWSENGGGNTGGHPEWHQHWRKPLREAFDWLRDTVNPIYEQEIQSLGVDPWYLRNEYITVILDRSRENVEQFITQHFGSDLTNQQKIKILKLLEIQHHAMLMYTSCGWFFDEVTGIETMQDILYAARVLQLIEDVTGTNYERHFLELLAKAESNIPEHQNAAVAYELFVRPSIVDMPRVGAHYAVSSLFTEYPEQTRIYSYDAKAENFELLEAGKYKLAIGKAVLNSEVTLEEAQITFATLHLGDHHLFGGVRDYFGEDAFQAMRNEVVPAFKKSRVHEAIVLLDKHFGTHNYSFWHLFKDDQKKILSQVLEQTLTSVEGTFRRVYEDNYSLLQAMKELSIDPPKPLKFPGEFTINANLRRLLQSDEINMRELNMLADSLEHLSVEIDHVGLNYQAAERINQLMRNFKNDPENDQLMHKVVQLIQACKKVHLAPDLWEAQNIAFTTYHQNYRQKCQLRDADDEEARAWCSAFETLFRELNIHVVDDAPVPQLS